MCWNIQVSLASASVGWATCLYLYNRNRSARDLWYARYLLTFTFTQIVDIALWMQNEQIPGGLQACNGMKEQFRRAPADEQYVQYMISKFVIPLVVFSQHAMQLTYPSNVLRNSRIPIILLHGLPLIGMCYQFGCSDLIDAKFPKNEKTIRWGAETAETWQILVMSGIVAFDFLYFIPEKTVAFMHVFVLSLVMSFLYVTEGTLALGSKWCTYCLVYSFVYLAEPLWGPPADRKKKTA
uniref:Uncharacterized protein n=1 Tax=Mucochytrium quahogii TaxID=96639 RepID=A0A7S2RQW4_9STRA|mmetsp:Transcript_78/g.182  ORF Transcript_78/g.182 Transcript_78/m.182 type:complete len:238 (+) Transcript_78:66-779(+)